MTVGERLSFVELFERHPEVSVPILQRDYVQGRASEAEVRGAFLMALRAALDKPADDPSLPLELDFVYGCIDSSGIFAPLDGQQRLTTLLLLHWYLAAREGCLLDFVRRITPERGSRFTYAVRASSREFFNALVEWRPIFRPGRRLSTDIADQPWFFLSWRLDPTIQSALTMLDAIHEHFADSDGLYARLSDPGNPTITFQVLDLKDFGLSDDLYIKMNARGRPLTGFETFKAQLEDHIEAVVPETRFSLHGREVGACEYISHRIDTAWADVLWHYRDRGTALFDDGFMNLIRAVVMVTRRHSRKPNDPLLAELRDRHEHFSFARYKAEGCLDADFIHTFVALLDAWSGSESGIRTLLPQGSVFSEQGFVQRLFKDATQLTYADWVRFVAYCGFVTSHPQVQEEAFGEWMRAIWNLTENTTYDNLDAFSRSAQSVMELLPHAPGILQYLASPAASAMKGFYGPQIREERIKASLWLRNDGWRCAVETAERHGYFAGQIEFLLDFAGVVDDWNEHSGFAWSADQEAGRLDLFNVYRDKAFAVFTQQGLNKLPDFLWERMLLKHGNYLLQRGSKYSFLEDFDRDVSWKRLLRGGQDVGSSKRKLVQLAFDGIDLHRGVEASLRASLEGATKAVTTGAGMATSPSATWRALLVEHPGAIDYCGSRWVRMDDRNRLYLIQQKYVNAGFAELVTFVLERRLAARKAEFVTGDLLNYSASSSKDVEPCIRGSFAGRSGRLQLHVVSDGNAALVITASSWEPINAGTLPEGFIDEMRTLGFNANESKISIRATLDLAEAKVFELASRAKDWDFERAATV